MTPGIRRSISKHFYGYCGDAKLLTAYGDIENWATQKLFAGLFITGGRANELVTLTKGQIAPDPTNDAIVWINRMLVLKQQKRAEAIDKHGNPVYVKQRIRHPDTRKWMEIETDKRKKRVVSVKDYRSFPIYRKDPLVDGFLEYIEEFTDPAQRIFPIKYGNVYYRIASIQAPNFYKVGGRTRTDWHRYKGPWWPHRLRAERASQLIVKYNFGTRPLMDWFGWKTQDEPLLYAKLNPQHLVELMFRGKL